MEVFDRKKRRKPTKRKRVNPCMESQPLASADQPATDTNEQSSAADDQNAKGSAERTATAAAADASQTGAVPSSSNTSHGQEQTLHTAVDGSPLLQASQRIISNQKEGLQATSMASADRHNAVEAVHEEGMAVAGSQDDSLAAVPPSDDEAEVRTQVAITSTL